MNRLKLIFALALLCTSCGQRQDPVSGPSAVNRTQSDTPSVRYTAADAGLKQAVAFSLPPQPPAGMLPGIPTSDRPLKLPMAIEEYSRPGSDSFMASANAINQGSTKVLQSTAGDFSFAVYQLPDIGPADEIKRLEVTTSVQQFAEVNGGYWVGVANYETGRWDALAPTKETHYRRTLSVSSQYRSPAGNAYIYVALGGDQSMRVDSVGMTIDRKGWQIVELEDNYGFDPAVYVDLYDRIHIAFAAHGVNPSSHYFIGLPDDDLSTPVGWTSSTIEAEPAGTPAGMDILLDSVTERPMVSLMYTSAADPATNHVGLSFLADTAQGVTWINYSFDSRPADGGSFTTIAQHLASGALGIAANAVNVNTPEDPPDDMQYRSVQLNNRLSVVDDEIQLTTGFADESQGLAFRFPHLRYSLIGLGAVVSGGLVVEELAEGGWMLVDDLAASEPFSSLAFRPDTQVPATQSAGMTYVTMQGGEMRLMFAGYTGDFAAHTDEEIDSIPVTVAGEWIGGCSQVEYMRDGTPTVAYSLYDGSDVWIKYAYKQGINWVTEDVSREGSEPGTTPDSVRVDLAQEPAEMFPGFTPRDLRVVVWSHREGTGSRLEVAMREGDD